MNQSHTHLIRVAVVDRLNHLISFLEQVDAKLKYLKQLRVSE